MSPSYIRQISFLLPSTSLCRLKRRPWKHCGNFDAIEDPRLSTIRSRRRVCNDLGVFSVRPAERRIRNSKRQCQIPVNLGIGGSFVAPLHLRTSFKAFPRQLLVFTRAGCFFSHNQTSGETYVVAAALPSKKSGYLVPLLRFFSPCIQVPFPESSFL